MTSEAFDNFKQMLERDKSPETGKIYEGRFREFCTFSSVRSANQLIALDTRAFEDKVKQHVDSLHNTGKGYSYLNQLVSAVRIFCLANRINLNYAWLYAMIPKEKVKVEGAGKDTPDLMQKPYSDAQLVRAFNFAKKKQNYRAIASMGTMYTGGARIGALPTIKIQYMQYVEKYDLYALLAYPNDPAARYWIITAPFLKPAIEKIRGKRTEGYLFVSHVDGSAVGKSGLVKEIYRIMVACGNRKPDENNNGTSDRYATMLDHGFRKAHSTKLEVAGLKDDHISRLRGNRKGLKGVYQLPTPLEIIELTEYVKAIPRLTLPVTL